MAWALQFSGAQYLDLSSDLVFSGDFSLSIRFKTPPAMATEVLIGRDSSSSDFIAFFSNGTIELKLGGEVMSPRVSGLSADTFYTVGVSRSGGLITFDIPDVGTENYNSTNNFTLNRIGSFNSSSLRFKGQIEYIESTGIINLDATSSSHGTGQPVLTDTIGTNDATGVNFPTDGSAWVDLGGGSTSIDATATETFNSFTDSSSSNIGANVSLSATEVLSSFQDSANTDISYNISVTTTETLSSFEDTSITSVVTQGEISSSVTEVFSSFHDSSAISLSVNVGTQVTEVLQSFVDSSIINLAKEINVSAGEVLAPFVDESTVKLPANWVVKTKAETSYTIKSNTTTNWTTRG